MVLRRLMARLLAIAAIVGLVIVPLATPAAAEPAASAKAAHSSMSADMPCCPDEQPSKDCPDCPLIAICVLKTTQAGPSPLVEMPQRDSVRTTHAVTDDPIAAGLARPPPDHPPRHFA